jgi:hypothetical protein
MMHLLFKASVLAFVLSEASPHAFRQLQPASPDKPKCRELVLKNKCEPYTKKINGEDPNKNMDLQQGDLITHRGILTDPTNGEEVGYMHSTCLLMYGGLNVGTGVAQVNIEGEESRFAFQGLFPTAEPHGNFELAILGSTGHIKNARGWIDMNMDDGGEGSGHPAIFHICGGFEDEE